MRSYKKICENSNPANFYAKNLLNKNERRERIIIITSCLKKIQSIKEAYNQKVEPQ